MKITFHFCINDGLIGTVEWMEIARFWKILVNEWGIMKSEHW
jgi:hypothetical protein